MPGQSIFLVSARFHSSLPAASQMAAVRPAATSWARVTLPGSGCALRAACSVLRCSARTRLGSPGWSGSGWISASRPPPLWLGPVPGLEEALVDDGGVGSAEGLMAEEQRFVRRDRDARHVADLSLIGTGRVKRAQCRLAAWGLALAAGGRDGQAEGESIAHHLGRSAHLFAGPVRAIGVPAANDAGRAVGEFRDDALAEVVPRHREVHPERAGGDRLGGQGGLAEAGCA